MNLALDIGNSRLKLGLFDEDRLVEQAIWADWTLQQLFDWATRRRVRHVILSSVAQPDAALTRSLAQHYKLLELDAHTPLPFENRYQTPETLGKDRLAAAAGAQALFPERHCLVVDCGTCIKYELLTAEGVYLGGNIAPGAHMRIQAMHHFTARLPEVAMHMPDSPVGNSTETALQNGALRGAALEIAGFVRLFRRKVKGPLQIILTGGDAPFFERQLAIKNIQTAPDLTLIGLNRILNHNLK